MEIFSDVTQYEVPLQWGHAFEVDYSDRVKVLFQLLSMLGGNRVDAQACGEVLLDHCKVEVFDTVEHTLKVNDFYLADVKDKEWEFAKRDKAFFSRPNLHNLLLWAA